MVPRLKSLHCWLEICLYVGLLDQDLFVCGVVRLRLGRETDTDVSQAEDDIEGSCWLQECYTWAEWHLKCAFIYQTVAVICASLQRFVLQFSKQPA